MARTWTQAAQYPVSYAAAFDVAVRCLQTLRLTIVWADPATGTIRAEKSMSVWSWGENVLVLVRSVGVDSTHVEVTSSLKFGLYDWGKNKKAVAAIHKAIADAISGGLATASAAPPAWHPDPLGRHEHRWWDGHQWTGSVSDQGVVSTDPPWPP